MNWRFDPCYQTMTINPATGLPMISGGMTGVDVAGNPFGSDLHQDLFGADSMFSCSPMFDHGFHSHGD